MRHTWLSKLAVGILFAIGVTNFFAPLFRADYVYDPLTGTIFLFMVCSFCGYQGVPEAIIGLIEKRLSKEKREEVE
jgi:hypothetical protein